MRRAFHQEFNQDAVKQFRDIEVKACHELLRRYVACPEMFMESIRQCVFLPRVIVVFGLCSYCTISSLAGRIIMRSAYGIDVKSEGDRFIEIGELALQAASAASNAGSYLVDLLPIRKLILLHLER